VTGGLVFDGKGHFVMKQIQVEEKPKRLEDMPIGVPFLAEYAGNEYEVVRINEKETDCCCIRTDIPCYWGPWKVISTYTILDWLDLDELNQAKPWPTLKCSHGQESYCRMGCFNKE
jgi:hypothetical protein